MSDETKLLAQAIQALAASSLDLITEQQQSRRIAQQMATTLVQIFEGQKQIVEQLENMNQRASASERRHVESEQKHRDSESKLRIHGEAIERIEKRVTSLEAARRPVGPSAVGSGGR